MPMSTALARATDTYRSVEVASRSPLELVAMLYEGATHALAQTRHAMQARDLVTKQRAMNKALAIVDHLQSTLDLEAGGHIAAELDRLYTYVIDRIVTANVTGEVERLDEALRVMSTLKEAWVRIAGDSKAAA